jgi:hypothetical protein
MASAVQGPGEFAVIVENTLLATDRRGLGDKVLEPYGYVSALRRQSVTRLPENRKYLNIGYRFSAPWQKDFHEPAHVCPLKLHRKRHRKRNDSQNRLPTTLFCSYLQRQMNILDANFLYVDTSQIRKVLHILHVDVPSQATTFHCLTVCFSTKAFTIPSILRPRAIHLGP